MKVHRHLKDAYPEAPREAAVFWSEFRRQADGVKREAPLRPRPWARRLSWASAAAAVAVAALWIAPRTRPATASEVLSVEASEQFSSVFLLADARGQATILWLAPGGGEPGEET